MSGPIEVLRRLPAAVERVQRLRAELAAAEQKLDAELAGLGEAALPLRQVLLAAGCVAGEVPVDQMAVAATALVQAPAEAAETLAPVVDETSSVAASATHGAVEPPPLVEAAAAERVAEAAVSVPAYAAGLGVHEVTIYPLIKRGTLVPPAVGTSVGGQVLLVPSLADAQILAAKLSPLSKVRPAVERRQGGASPAPSAPPVAAAPAPASVSVGEYARGLNVPNGAIAVMVKSGQLRRPAVTSAKRIVPELADQQILRREFKKPSVVQERVRARTGFSAAEQEAVERAIAEGKITRDPGPARFEGGMRFDGKGGGTVEIGL